MSEGNVKDSTSNKNKLEQPRKFRVVIFNDDFTPYQFVIDLLKKVFRKDDALASVLTSEIHSKGSSTIGLYTRDIAETKVQKATDMARAAGHPLIIQSTPE